MIQQPLLCGSTPKSQNHLLAKLYALLCSVHCSIIHGGPDMETMNVSSSRGSDKEDVAHMYCDILLRHKKRCIVQVPLLMDLENISLSKVGQRKWRTVWFHSYVGCNTETHRYRQQYGGYQREGDGWDKRVKGAKYMMREDGLTLGGGHTIQYTDHES